MPTDDTKDAPTSSELARCRASLSALMDGDDGAVDAACRAWRDDASLRADWHAYHLIGEVMRSEDAALGATAPPVTPAPSDKAISAANGPTVGG